MKTSSSNVRVLWDRYTFWVPVGDGSVRTQPVGVCSSVVVPPVGFEGVEVARW